MEEDHTHFSFEQWITYVFDHPLPNPGAPQWYFESNYNGPWWDPYDEPETTVAYLTMLFEQATSTLASFSDAQVMQGLWFLISNASCEAMFSLLDTGVPWSDRKRCIFSMFTLFECLFAPRCSAHLSHRDIKGTDTSQVNPLNMVCYMWWDILPIHGKPEEPDRRDVDATFLEVMRLTLDLDADSCREAALHGLGHWKYTYPEEVETIIDTWLARHQELGEELKEYALAARRGAIM
jgi:hypothetical protein